MGLTRCSAGEGSTHVTTHTPGILCSTGTWELTRGHPAAGTQLSHLLSLVSYKPLQLSPASAGAQCVLGAPWTPFPLHVHGLDAPHKFHRGPLCFAQLSTGASVCGLPAPTLCCQTPEALLAHVHMGSSLSGLAHLTPLCPAPGRVATQSGCHLHPLL